MRRKRWRYQRARAIYRQLNVTVERRKAEATHLIEDEEDIIQRYGADQIQEEPGADVMAGDQLGVQDDLLRVVLMHDALSDCNISFQHLKMHPPGHVPAPPLTPYPGPTPGGPINEVPLRHTSV